MKKIIKFVIILLIVMLILQFGITLFKQHHSVTYKMQIDDKKAIIHEEYYHNKKDDYYLFNIAIDNKQFTFDFDNKFNKQKKVIKDIRIYEQDELMCISPLYVKNNDESKIYCNIDNRQYSYNYAKDKYDLTSFIATLNNFDKDKYNSINTTTTASNNKIFNKNIYDNEIVLLYEYNDLVKVTNKDNNAIKFADYDIYNNNLGILIDKYYILPKYENLPLYNSLLIIDILKNKVEEMPISLSTNIYINGVVDNKLYLLDKSNLMQYQIDPSKKKYEITGTKNNAAKYYDGKWSNKNIYEFYNNTLLFTKDFPLDDYIEAFEGDRAYYYYNSNNEFYKVYKKDLSNKIYLFKYDDINEVRVVNNNIYFICKDTIYRYDEYGIKPIIINNEFNYNYKNIYSIYYKK